MAEEEFTGYSHRFTERDQVKLYEFRGDFFLTMTAKQATFVHQEHGPITLDAGDSRVCKRGIIHRVKFVLYGIDGLTDLLSELHSWASLPWQQSRVVCD